MKDTLQNKAGGGSHCYYREVVASSALAFVMCFCVRYVILLATPPGLTFVLCPHVDLG